MNKTKENSLKKWKQHLEVAIRAAQEAGNIQLEAFDKTHTVDYKGETDLVTEVDRACEKAIVQTIKKVFSTHDFLLEESLSIRTDSSCLWVVDPLDGTTNYAHRYPHFCCSIALQYEGQTVLGVVFDPVRNELFTALRNKGAFLNGQPLSVSKEDRLIRCLLATGFPYNIKTAGDDNVSKFAEMLPLTRGIRRAGSAALDLCYLAAGRLDGYWVLRLEPWDVTAGILMIEEAGGVVTDGQGASPSLQTKEFVASNGRIQQTLLDILCPDVT